MRTMRIATRKSPLALWQARHVARCLRESHPGLKVDLIPMSTSGDRMLDAPLAKVGGKGLFVKELEKALFDERADIAVHSIKDVTVELPAGLHMPVITARDDPRDALVSNRYRSLDALPRGACVGTSSLRRRCQVLDLRPDLRVENLRGGVNTRLGKLDAGEFDAIVLACVGLARLGLGDRVAQAFSPELMLPAVGQGALGIECRRGDGKVEELIGVLHHAETARCVLAERAMNKHLEGGCQVPIAGHAQPSRHGLRLRGLVSCLDASKVLREDRTSAARDPAELGIEVAQALLAQGAGEILAEVYGAA